MAGADSIAPDAFWHKPNGFGSGVGGPITVEVDGGEASVRPSGDGVVIKNPDGTVTVDWSVKPLQAGGKPAPSKFDDNLADQIDDGELSQWAEMLLEGIDADEQSRSEWMATRRRGLELLGLKIEDPKADVSGSSGAPVEGMSSVRDPALTEAVVRGQANAIGEFLPTEGPVKIEDTGDDPRDDLADVLEKDVNHYLTKVATEYYPDTKRMLARLYFGGFGVKKVYNCPLRRRPVSESIEEQNFLVSNAATDILNADRVTHIVEMRQSTFRRMVAMGHYRNVAAPQPVGQTDSVTGKLEEIQGVRKDQTRPEDQPYTLYEVCCERHLPDIEPETFALKGKDVPLPYIVTIEKDSRRILAVKRDWDEDDEDCMRKRMYVDYNLITWIGFYGIGLLHLMGNLTNALTAMLREAIDSGMMANFPGGVAAKSPAAKQDSNQIIAGPGQFVQLDLGSADDIRKDVMPFPYKDVTPGFVQVMEMARQYAQKLGGTADLPIGEGKQDAPVGTTLALIEQATKVEAAAHKGMHQSQAEEFQLFVERFREDPEALWRFQRQRRGKQMTTTWDRAKLLQALDDYDLVPKADPNTPSHFHRIMKAVARLQLAQAAPPGVFNLVEVYKEALRVLGDAKPEKYLAPPNPNPPQPSPQDIIAQAKLKDAQTKAQQAAVDAQNKQQDAASKALDRQSKEKIAETDLARELVIHANDVGQAQREHAMDTAAAQHGQAMDVASHDLALRQHALDATKAAHEAAMDVHAVNQPQETPQ